MNKMTYELAHALWRIDPLSGHIWWKSRNNKGKPAGSPNNWGHLRVSHQGKSYYVHRLVWLMCTRRWPIDMLDHINGDPSDNRLENLREVTRHGNRWNSRQNRELGRLPYTRYVSPTNLWEGQYIADGAVIRCGPYTTAQQAHNAVINDMKRKQCLHFRLTPPGCL